MGRVRNGVSWYTTGTATIPVHFPEDRTVCAFCPYLTRVYGVRHQCKLTDEMLLYPESSRGHDCPVKFDEKEVP